MQTEQETREMIECAIVRQRIQAAWALYQEQKDLADDKLIELQISEIQHRLRAQSRRRWLSW